MISVRERNRFLPYPNFWLTPRIVLNIVTPEELIPGLLGLSGIQAFAPVFGV
jgi:hypothetical protein